MAQEITAREPSISGNAAVAVDTVVAPGRQFAINCTVAGNVQVQFADASTYTFPVSFGLTILPWEVAKVISGGTTATATYANLL